MTILSPHFTLEEMAHSQIAARYGISNIPPPEVIGALRSLCVEALEPVRVLVKAPIHISSGYRSPRVNKLAGGSRGSQHRKGEAADIFIPTLTAPQLFDLIRKSNIVWDQLIEEFGGWVHISFTAQRGNRRDALIARKIDGKTVYRRLGE